MITLEDIRQAQGRIAPHIRETPLIRADALSAPISEAELWLKLECLQATGSFKARGATNKLLATLPDEMARGVTTASGGNHGLAVARAARLAGVPATIFVPTNVANGARPSRSSARSGTRPTSARSPSRRTAAALISTPSPIPSWSPGKARWRSKSWNGSRTSTPC